MKKFVALLIKEKQPAMNGKIMTPTFFELYTVYIKKISKIFFHLYIVLLQDINILQC